MHGIHCLCATSCIKRTFKALVAVSKASCILPGPKKPRSPCLLALLQWLSFSATAPNAFLPDTMSSRSIAAIWTASSCVQTVTQQAELRQSMTRSLLLMPASNCKRCSLQCISIGSTGSTLSQSSTCNAVLCMLPRSSTCCGLQPLQGSLQEVSDTQSTRSERRAP